MAIINDYDAIARRLRELNPPPAGKDDDVKTWQSLAEETARAYVESRRREPVADGLRRRAQPIIPRRAVR